MSFLLSVLAYIVLSLWLIAAVYAIGLWCWLSLASGAWTPSDRGAGVPDERRHEPPAAAEHLPYRGVYRTNTARRNSA